MLDLLPWYTGPHAATLTAAFDQATQLITTRAMSSQRTRRRPSNTGPPPRGDLR
jgi:hypothetical protein